MSIVMDALQKADTAAMPLEVLRWVAEMLEINCPMSISGQCRPGIESSVRRLIAENKSDVIENLQYNRKQAKKFYRALLIKVDEVVT